MTLYLLPCRVVLGAVLAGAISEPVLAAALPEKNYQLSGFISLVGGKLLNGSLGKDYSGPSAINGVDCPCYIADWGNAGIYSDDLSLKPESRAGAQLKWTLTPQVNAVAQVVVRGADTKPNLQWAFVSYKPSKQVEFQLGRKRIPLYYYSDFQDIGFSYPWVSVPPELYGWEVTNFNGASARYRADLDSTSVNASVFAGRESVKESLYQRLYYPTDTKVTWSSLVGGDVELNRGAVTARAVYMQADVRTSNPVEALDDSAKLSAYGIAVNIDLEDWFVLSEATQLKRNFAAGYRVTAPAMTVGIGYRWGDWTSFLNHARYKERTSDLSTYAPQSFSRTSLTLRYDLDPRNAVKVQLDRQRDDTRNFGGHSNVVRMAYDRLF